MAQLLLNTDTRNNQSIDVESIHGSELHIINVARTSTGRECTSMGDREIALLATLYNEHHGSPFEFVTFTFDIVAPIFVARQWFRHRIGSFCESSMRYRRGGELGFFHMPSTVRDAEHLDSLVKSMLNIYNTVTTNTADKRTRELVRAILPTAVNTRFRWQVNLRALINFISLRTTEHAQPEIRIYADAIYHQCIRENFPNLYTLMCNNLHQV